MRHSTTQHLQFNAQKQIIKTTVELLRRKQQSLSYLRMAYKTEQPNQKIKNKIIKKLLRKTRRISRMENLSQKILNQLKQIRKLSRTDLRYKIREQQQFSSSQQESRQILIADLIEDYSQPEMNCEGIMDERDSGFYFNQQQDQEENGEVYEQMDSQSWSEEEDDNEEEKIHVNRIAAGLNTMKKRRNYQDK